MKIPKFREIITVQNSPKWIFFILLVTLLSGILTILGFLGDIGQLYKLTLGEKKYEENIVNSLSAGLSINYFKEKLGNEFMEKIITSDINQYIFKRYTYYIQALADKSNTVIFWSITDCNSKKTFTIRSPWLDRVVLHKSSFGELFEKSDNPSVNYFKGITANSYVYESLYLGNPSGYQTAYIGINDACSDEITPLFSLSDDVIDKAQDRKLEDLSSNLDIQTFRNNSKINTYGETAPFQGDLINQLLKDRKTTFGIDRIELRLQR
jgi:hypothetical protein